MSEATESRLNWDEIKRRFPDEWVALCEVDGDETDPELRSGVLLGHGKSRRELSPLSKAAAHRGVRTVVFTGPVGRGSFRF